MIRTMARILLMAAILPGCTTPGDPAREWTAHTSVDSTFPIEVELQRFRAGITRAPDSLAMVAESREELVRRFIYALEAGDSLSLSALLLDRAEFAYLYYPSSQYSREPYRLDPALLWFLIGENGHKGHTRALRRYGGRSLGYAGHRCDPEPKREGENLLWTGCVLLSTQSGEHGRQNAGAQPRVDLDEPGTRLFGTIIERAGRFKFVSYANSL